MGVYSTLYSVREDERVKQELAGPDEREYARLDRQEAAEAEARELAAWGNQTAGDAGPEFVRLGGAEGGDALAVFGLDAPPPKEAKPPGRSGEESPEPPKDDAKRQAHEAAEAKRRAEWEAAQAEKRASEQAQLDRVAAMSPDDVAALSVKRVSADTERLTRRNMKDCVSGHIQSLCHEDLEFARRVLHPRKTMANCFKYIYRQAQEFAKQEMKDLGESHVNGVYGLDVPDGLCYQWAEEYFNDPDAPEDKEKDDKFVPKPYCGGGKAKAAPEKKPAQKPRSKPKAAIDGQISLLGEVG